jgi:hypothetical protein
MPVYTQNTANKVNKIVAPDATTAVAITQERATIQRKGIDVSDSSGRIVASVAPKPEETRVSTWVKPR